MRKITGGKIQERKKKKKKRTSKPFFFFLISNFLLEAFLLEDYMGASKGTRDTQEFFRPFLEFCTHALQAKPASHAEV